MEPAAGLEPATCCLQNSCSTAELRRRVTFLSAGMIAVYERDVNFWAHSVIPTEAAPLAPFQREELSRPSGGTPFGHRVCLSSTS